MHIPKLIKVKQTFEKEHITDIEATVKKQILDLNVSILPGANIAVAVGSRGIVNMKRIVKATVDALKGKGANPFIIPAMGSHGGGNAEGQEELLASYGITEAYTGVPIKSSMQVIELPQGDLKNKVYMDKHAYEADGTVVINRIKVHTDFHGPFESGLLKMCVIGLGKHKQAIEIHRHGVYGLKELIPLTARQVLKEGNIIMGIGIVENAYDQTAIIKAVKPSEMEQEELKMIAYCRAHMPSILVKKLDVLIVDQMGKDISGIGMDTNIIGRIKIKNEVEPGNPDITNIVVTDLTEASHGNASGMGLADFITKTLYEKINFKVTYENMLTSTFLERAKMPIVVGTDKLAVQYALRTCGPIESEDIKMIRIKNTLHLDEIYVSTAVFDEIKDREDIEVIGEYQEMFGDKGKLLEF